MRLLILPCSNSLSHVVKGVQLRENCVACGHEALLAVGAGHSPFLKRLGVPHEVLRDIQEADAGAFPTFTWFQPRNFAAALQAEAELIRRTRPDRVLGIFRFTGPLSCRLAGVPYDSLICGCMLPECGEVLGFARGEPGTAQQATYLHTFRTVSARRIRKAAAPLGLEGVDDLWELLKGERTFLWDFPEFQALPPDARVRHVGPFWWRGWPRDPATPSPLAPAGTPLAVVAFGTAGAPVRVVELLVRSLLDLGWSVALAAGGQRELLGILPGERRLARCEFLSMDEALPQAGLLLCHGGQGIVFDALRHRVPVLVLPSHPEQSHNGACLERLGCGLRLMSSVPFHRRSDFEEAIAALDRPALQESISRLTGAPGLGERLARVSRTVSSYDGAATLARLLTAPA